MWKQTSEAKYWQALEVLPPAYQDGYGFLLGEPHDHYKCDVCGNTLPRYDAYVQKGDRYYVSIRPLTIPEYKKYVAKLVRKKP